LARRGRNKFKESELGEVGDFFSSTFGFAWDAIKVIFKLTPDEDQGFSEFIFEKLGAVALLLVVLVVLGFAVAALYFEVTH
jgi:hypothetical protein